jgi:hypothetical protein
MSVVNTTWFIAVVAGCGVLLLGIALLAAYLYCKRRRRRRATAPARDNDVSI